MPSGKCRDIVALSEDEAPVTSEPAASSHEIRQAAANVTALSDDEAVEALPDKPQKRKRSRRVSYVLVRGAVVRALAGACRCRRARDDNRNCLDGFQDALDDLTALRVKLLSLHKQDMDEEALGLKYLNCSFHHGPWFLGERISVGFLQLLLLVDIPPILTKLCWRWNCKLVDPMGQVSKMLGGQRGPGRGRSLSLLGKPCCLSAFRKLLGVGSGRICRLTAAVKQGQPCPLDGRFLTRSKLNLVSLKAAKKRAIVVGFLEEMLQSISEPQPEAWRKQEGIPKKEGPAANAHLGAAWPGQVADAAPAAWFLQRLPEASERQAGASGEGLLEDLQCRPSFCERSKVVGALLGSSLNLLRLRKCSVS